MCGGIALLNRVKDGMPTSDRVMLYHAFVEPHLDYCAPVWSAASEGVKETLRVTQRRALRAIVDYDRDRHAADLFVQFNVQTADERWRMWEAIWLYKILNPEKAGATPDYMKNLIQVKESVYNLRQSKRIEANCKSALGDRLFSRRLRELFERKVAADFWNSETLNSFKIRIRSCISSLLL